jgi:hypothetical protein
MRLGFLRIAFGTATFFAFARLTAPFCELFPQKTEGLNRRLEMDIFGNLLGYTLRQLNRLLG